MRFRTISAAVFRGFLSFLPSSCAPPQADRAAARSVRRSVRLSIADIQKHKANLRKIMRKRRRALTPAQQRKAAVALYKRIVTSPLFRFRRRISFTLARDGEISPHLLMKEALRRGKECFLPVLNPVGPSRLQFRRVFGRRNDMKTNRYGIPEPRRSQRCPPRALGLVLLPLVAFDANCNRLGMGKGFYDHTFAFLRHSKRQSPQLLGLAHDCQRVESLEVASWDVPLGGVVTDEAWYLPRSLKSGE